MRSASPRSFRRALTPATVALGLIVGTAVATAGLTGSVPAAHADVAAPTTASYATAAAATPGARALGEIGAEPIAEITEASAAALTDAEALLDAAPEVVAAIKAEVTEAKLDLDVAAVEIDTAGLEDLAGELRAVAITPTLFIPTMTDEAVAETARVQSAVDTLQDAFKAAQVKKAAEEAAKKAAAKKAAEKKAAEAKAQAEREAAAQASAQRSAPSAASGPSKYSGGDARGIARDMVAQRGWGGDQFSCLDSLWQRESGWNYRAQNPSSGAYGIPQALPGSKMASAGGDWQTNPATQIAWGLSYIEGRYGTPCGAWGHSQSHGWY